MAGPSNNSINNTCVDVFYFLNSGYPGSLIFTGNTISDEEDTDIYFYPSIGYETIVDTSTAGVDIGLEAYNTNPGNSSIARLLLIVGGSTAADPYILFTNNVVDWAIGMDNSDNDKFVISGNSTLGTNNVFTSTLNGEINLPMTTAFAAFNTVTDVDVTGDGTDYSIICDETVFNNGSNYSTGTGVFTAGCDGIYKFELGITVADISAANYYYSRIATTDYTFRDNYIRPYVVDVSGNYITVTSILCEMDEGDTAVGGVRLANETGKDIDVTGTVINPYTYFTGNLEA